MYLFLLFVFFVLSVASQGGFDVDRGEMLIDWSELMFATTITPGLIGFYSGYTFLFTRFLSKRKIALFFLFGFLITLFSGFCGVVVLSSLKGISIMFADGWNSAIPETIVICFFGLINCIMGLIFRGFITSYADIKTKEELNKKNYEMELNLIRAQLNPHFLFNTLNNIDLLILKDANKASLYLNKLSHIIRFMLYETKTEKIPLGKELLYIEKYLDLQSIRNPDPSFINYHVEGDIDNLLIEPMLFIPFIENAFKFVQADLDKKSITINFKLESGKIIFTCSNTFNRNADHTIEAGGLGVALIQKRLQLLYPDKHTLYINDDNNIYNIVLSLHTNENEMYHR